MGLPFSKMHGIGNDFVIVDGRHHPVRLSEAHIRELGDRHTGIGFDQLLCIEPASDPTCTFAYAIWNSDGTPARQCGNGVRCVARWLARAGAIGRGMTRLQGPVGAVACELMSDGGVRVDMGEPIFSPADIPFLAPAEADRYTIETAANAVEIGAVSMGNPHAVIEVKDVATAPVAIVGAEIENTRMFPQRCNVGFAQVIARDAIALRVWERGVGETLACGSGACAAVAVLRRRDKLDADVSVALPGGTLALHWQGTGHAMWMSGPTAFVFEGECDA